MEAEKNVGTVSISNEPMLYIEKIFPDAKTPVKSNITDSGFDIYGYNVKTIYQNYGGNGERKITDAVLIDKAMFGTSITLSYLERILIGTGISATVGPGYEIQVRPRSGLALKQGLTICNTPGTIDEAYKDEIGIILINLSRAEQTIDISGRIAQLVVAPVALPEIEVVSCLPTNMDRGGGFGHTGNK